MYYLTFFSSFALYNSFIIRNYKYTQKYIDKYLLPKVNLSWLSPRSISTGQLHTLLYFHLQPINQVVFLESYYFNSMGYLILRWASHLDAFSVYPFHT